MPFKPKVWWTSGVLIALAACSSAPSLFPDQLFPLYLEVNRWLAAGRPVPPFSIPTPTDDARTFQEDFSRKPFIILPVGTVMGLISGRRWEPTETEILALEMSLPMVSCLRPDNRLAVGDRRIDFPEQYFRQYVPFLRQGRRLIYVNAFRDASPDWEKRLVVIMDGGTRCWQAYYDPTAHAFLHLTVNGQ